MPSESEWEYAARNRELETDHPWGSDDASCDLVVMDDVNHGPGCDAGTTWTKSSRPDGNTDLELCAMAGNVWEWTQDWYHNSYVGAPAQGEAWVDPVGSDRVIRGASLTETEAHVYASNRGAAGPTMAHETIGFRCAR